MGWFPRGLRALEADGFLSSPDPELLPMLACPPVHRKRENVASTEHNPKQVTISTTGTWYSLKLRRELCFVYVLSLIYHGTYIYQVSFYEYISPSKTFSTPEVRTNHQQKVPCLWDGSHTEVGSCDVTTLSGVSNERQSQSAPEEPGRICRIAVVTRDRTWYQTH